MTLPVSPVSVSSVVASSKTGAQLDPAHLNKLKDASVKLEAVFLAEMLKSAGLGKAQEGLGGGSGEDQFSSLLANLQAEEMARAGGIGLAEQIFETLKEQEYAKQQG